MSLRNHNINFEKIKSKKNKRHLAVMISAIVFNLCVYLKCLAKSPSAILISNVLTELNSAPFSFVDRDLVVGYFSLQSCLYTHSSASILKHYCYPKAKHPARSMTLIGPKFGVVYVYEEIEGPFIRKEIAIDTFPEHLSEFSGGPYSHWMIRDWNKAFKYFSENSKGSCWSTNFSSNHNSPESDCYLLKITDYMEWSKETMGLVNNLRSWDLLWEQIEKNTPDQEF